GFAVALCLLGAALVGHVADDCYEASYSILGDTDDRGLDVAPASVLRDEGRVDVHHGLARIEPGRERALHLFTLGLRHKIEERAHGPQLPLRVPRARKG